MALSMSALAEKDKSVSLAWTYAALSTLGSIHALLKVTKGTIRSGQYVSPLNQLGFVALDTHFNVKTWTEPLIEAVEFILKNYINDMKVLVWSNQYFVDDTTSAEAAKGTPAHVPPPSNRVLFTPAFCEWEPATGQGFGPLCRAAMVLHEPIHVIDPLASTRPAHVGENEPSYAFNPADNQIHNPHSYAAFAQHCYYGMDTRFGAGKRNL